MIQPSAFIKVLLALIVALGVTGASRAQEGVRGLWPDTPDVLVGDALATPYADAMLKQFAANVRKSGDPACLLAKGFDDAALITRGRALWQMRGVQMLKMLEQTYDPKAYQAALSATAGRNAAAELEQVRKDPDVKKLIAISRPLKLASTADQIVEEFDRYVVIKRIKLDAVHPNNRGETEIMKDNPTEAMRANPVQATEKAMQEFYDQQKSKRIERYLELTDAAAAASVTGFKTEELAKLGPMQFFAGADQDLAQLCVGPK